MKYPKKIELANLPTRIEKLERFSKQFAETDIYIKRDDQTGSEFSGNKIRKLEYTVKEAIDQGCDTLITCGGIQSNHARATAAVAARLGLKSYLVLRCSEAEIPDGNYFMDGLLGAQIKLINHDEYKKNRLEIMKSVKSDLENRGQAPYIIPEGASNGIGNFGYFSAYEEILNQENAIGVTFDAIVVAVGSGGTYAGLFYANKYHNKKREVYGVSVCDDAEFFTSKISSILCESFDYTGNKISYNADDIKIIDGYKGRGYALSRPEELQFIRNLAQQEGIILDPVYTGKAMFGLANEIHSGNFKNCNNILFIHTGGLFGLFPKRELFVNL
ncbi:MAG TPA: D-cysteine desulfhydrase family protein [Victivallales bacterium]|nr:D-cysteine desulfhydrase family protein [Victivallales bacterium]